MYDFFMELYYLLWHCPPEKRTCQRGYHRFGRWVRLGETMNRHCHDCGYVEEITR